MRKSTPNIKCKTKKPCLVNPIEENNRNDLLGGFKMPLLCRCGRRVGHAFSPVHSHRLVKAGPAPVTTAVWFCPANKSPLLPVSSQFEPCWRRKTTWKITVTVMQCLLPFLRNKVNGPVLSSFCVDADCISSAGCSLALETQATSTLPSKTG